MVGIVRLALRRPYSFIVTALPIMILGVASAIRTPADIFPNINIPVIRSVFSHTGLSTDDMASGRSIVGATLLAGSAVPAFAAPVTTAEADRGLPMTFTWRREGPAEVCGTKCRWWISAIGSITAETPGDFAAFARNHDVRGAVLVLDSSGGSVLGTLELGRMIRRLDMTTTVGRTIPLPAQMDAEARAILASEADCESMCAFLLLAGTRRYVPAEALVLVHQIWLGDRRDDATAASYSAEDLMVIQRDIGRLVQYTIEMGGGADLIETAMRIPPWERLRPLSAEELIRTKLQTGDIPFERTPSEPASVPASPASTTASVHAAAMDGRGWSVIERSGQPMLARRHPSPSKARKSELRSDLRLWRPRNIHGDLHRDTQAPGYNRTPLALKDVSISAGLDSAILKVIMSEAMTKPPELVSSARGIVSAAFMQGLPMGTAVLYGRDGDHERYRNGNPGGKYRA